MKAKLIYFLIILAIGSFTFAAGGPKKPNKTVKLDPTHKKAYVHKSLLESADTTKTPVLELIPDGYTVVEKPR